MDFPSPLSARLCHPRLHRQTLSSIRIPSLSFLEDLPTRPAKRQRTSSGAHGSFTPEWQEQVVELREWMGLVAVAAEEKLQWVSEDVEDDPGEGWGVPLDACEERAGEVIHLGWNGFFHPKLWSGILDALLASSSSNDSCVCLPARLIPSSR